SYAKALAVGLVGLAGHVVEVEADLAAGLPGLTLTGLPDAALSEARDRVRAALVNSGETWPVRRITVNLLPAALPKHGSVFDLAPGPRLDIPAIPPLDPATGADLADVVGQELGRRGLEIAAAGGHHLLLVGPPGAGKTMLARRLPSILPPLSDAAALEVTAVHSIAGALPVGTPMIRHPPFQAPHHTSSVQSLVGGGAGLARPGAISLAHLGVLFLDEAPEFGTRALETLRQ